MLGINEQKIIVKGEFAKAVRKAAKESVVHPATNKTTNKDIVRNHHFDFEWK